MAQTASGPSAFCHITDGEFTICPDGNIEWSDIPVVYFPEGNSYLYADQADMDPLVQSIHPVTGEVSDLDTFMLMYDECDRTTSLGPDEYFLVNFDTVELENGIEKLERYSIHIFGDGTIIFFEDGELETDETGNFRVEEINGQRGYAGFGPSPTCPFDHLIVEYQIILETAGGNSYSPDPLFWGGQPPNSPPIAGNDSVMLDQNDPTTINVLANDTDADGSIDISTVTIVSPPTDGTVTVNSNGTVEYSRGNNFDGNDAFTYTVRDDEGAVSNVAVVEIVGPCKPGILVPVSLSKVEVSPQVPLKPYRVTYDDISLQFTSGNTQSPSYCTLLSNTGVLEVLVTFLVPPIPPFVPINVATSTATARLDFHKAGDVATPPACDFVTLSNNCLLGPPPASSGDLVKWSTPGFVIQDTLTNSVIRNTGPLAFWTASSSGSSLAAKVQSVETFFHRTLIGRLAAIDSIAVIQDPPSDILVTDPNGLRTGQMQDGQILTEIPGSLYFVGDENRAVIIIEPMDGAYEIQVIGTPSEPFDLSMSRVDFFRNVFEPIIAVDSVQDTIGPSGVNTYTFEMLQPPRTSFNLGSIRSGFDSNILPANDDGSTGLVSAGFAMNFFGTNYDSLYVNNNGNLTFDSPLSTFTPFDLSSTGRVIVAPYFADVDTRVGNVVTYGQGTVDGRPAFGATWPGVGCYNANTSVLNFFQVLLIDRSDIAPGDFDIEFNYDAIQWETGQASGGNVVCQGGASARVGFSNGTSASGTFFELPGSGVPGTFLDTNLENGLIHNSFNSPQLGRYLFEVRGGDPDVLTADVDNDTVDDELDNCPGNPNPGQEDSNLNGIGDACETDSLQHSTAGFLQALLNGGTTAEATSLNVSDEPDLIERLFRIVDFRVSEGLTDSPEELTANLVGSLVDVGLVPPEEADELINDVLQQVVTQVDIDIKPSSDPNSINCTANNTVVPVAILTTDTFDATTVDHTTVTFEGASETHIDKKTGQPQRHEEDVDGEGDIDLVFHFRLGDTDLTCSSTEGTLTGETFDGSTIQGTDAVRMVGGIGTTATDQQKIYLPIIVK